MAWSALRDHEEIPARAASTSLAASGPPRMSTSGPASSGPPSTSPAGPASSGPPRRSVSAVSVCGPPSRSVPSSSGSGPPSRSNRCSAESVIVLPPSRTAYPTLYPRHAPAPPARPVEPRRYSYWARPQERDPACSSLRLTSPHDWLAFDEAKRTGRRAELGCLTRTTKRIMSQITQPQMVQSELVAPRTIYNFSAGPGVLPAPVLLKAQEELIDWHGTGMSVMEMSHRGKDFISIAEDAEARLRALMPIPDSYKVLFLQGGATGQFVGVPANLSTASGIADYVITGQWGQKAYTEASKYLDKLNVAARTDPHTYVPPQSEWRLSRDAAYVHITLNETVNGVVFDKVPDTGDVPLVADVSSIILSEPIDVTKFGALYAGAQKNIGPAGLTLVIVREDLLARTRPRTPAVWDWFAMAQSGSMLNTPPTYSWYIAGLVFE